MTIKAILTFALLLGAASPALADNWIATTKLSGVQTAGPASAAIDANGNAVVIWGQRATCGGHFSCDLIQSRSRAPGKPWGALVTVSGQDPSVDANAPTLHMSETGTATAVWPDDNGLETADRPLGQPWTKPVLLIPGFRSTDTFSFVEDRNGDRAILYAGTIYLRPTGGAWHTVKGPIPDSVPYADTDDIAISVTGDLVVSWESYDRRCNERRKCTPINYRLHASRLAAGASGWQDSGVLAGPDSGVGTGYGNHRGWLAIDDSARAGLISVQNDTVFTVRTNAPAQPWSVAAPLATTNKIGLVNGFQSDAAGNATVLVTEAGGRISAIGGSLAGGPFTFQATLSANDSAPFTPYLAVSPSGSAAAIWGFGDPNYIAKAISATTRPSANAPWRPRVDLTGILTDGAPQAIAAAGVDHAVASWSDADNALTLERVNGAVHQP